MRKLLVMASAVLLVGSLLLIVPETDGRGRGGRGGSRGSVRHSGGSRGHAQRSTPSRGSAGRTPDRGRSGTGGRPGTGPGGRPGTGPGRPGGTAGRRSAYHAGYRHGRYNGWHDARRDYFRFRTINHLIRVGAYVATRPRTSTTVVVTGTTYYYVGGVFYTTSGSGYVVVNAPPSAVVHAVPTSATVVYVGTTPYYYYGGTYYVATQEPAPHPPEIDESDQSAEADDTQKIPPMTEDDHNYKVVGPPVGTTVPYIPEEANEETISGKKYFVYGGTYYRPFSSDGDTVYMVMEDPREKPS